MVHVVDFVERRLELPRVPVDGELLHDRVIHHQRQPVDEAFLGDVLGLQQVGPIGLVLRERRRGLGGGDGQGRDRNGEKQVAFRQHRRTSFRFAARWSERLTKG